MVNLYIDSNYLFDITERNISKRNVLNGNGVFVSPLSYHIFFYTYKYKVPQKQINDHKDEFYFVDLKKEILSKALVGPTHDLEDNIQLNSAAEVGADYFLTSDKKLLKLGYFGKTKIVDSILPLE